MFPLKKQSTFSGNVLAFYFYGRQQPCSLPSFSRAIRSAGYESEDLSLKVLVADDTLISWTLAARILEKRGHAVMTFEKGAEASSV
jgi:hypothetical protein